MNHTFYIRSVDIKNGTFVVQFEGLDALNYFIPFDSNGFLTGTALEEAMQKMYPWNNGISEQIANFTNGSDIEKLVISTQIPSPTIESVRVERNGLLFQSDWTQLNDAPFTNEQKTEWAIYRQALRDVPEQSGFPQTVILPTMPA
jgi:Phage tail assembly chaperone protein